MQCVILAGGLASRLSPLTDTIPKSLISFNDSPFLFYQLEWLRSSGVTDVVLCIGHMGQMIRDYAGDGTAWDLTLRYVDEGPELRGTAGALRLAAEKGLLNDSFLVTYGDSFLPIDFVDVWRTFKQQELPALMTVFKNEGKWDTSNVWFDGNRIALYDKFRAHAETAHELRFIDYGLSAFRRETVEQMIPAGKSDLANLFYRLSRENRLAGKEVSTRFYEIGSPAGLKDFEGWLKQNPEFAKNRTKPQFVHVGAHSGGAAEAVGGNQ